MLVLCTGMIRSGSTLQFNIVRNLVDLLGAGESHGYMTQSEMKSREKELFRWEKDDKYHVVKTHDLIGNLNFDTRSRGLRICYIHRDLRDVAASAKMKWNLDEVKLFEKLDRAVLVYYKVRESGNALVEKYEEVVADIANSAFAIAGYLELKAGENTMDEVIDRCSLGSMLASSNDMKKDLVLGAKRGLRAIAKKVLGPRAYKKIRSITPGFQVYDRESLLHPDHISRYKGAVGIWRNELSDEEIRVVITRYKEYMSDCGYVL